MYVAYLVNAHLSSLAQHGKPNSLMTVSQKLLYHLQCPCKPDALPVGCGSDKQVLTFKHRWMHCHNSWHGLRLCSTSAFSRPHALDKELC